MDLGTGFPVNQGRGQCWEPRSLREVALGSCLACGSPSVGSLSVPLSVGPILRI